MLQPTGVDGDVAGGTVHAFCQHWGYLNQKLILVVGDPVDTHAEHESCDMVEGSPWFTINAIPVCRFGDHAECGHPLVASQAWFLIS